MGFFSIFIGAVIIYASLLLLRRELRQGLQVMRKHYPGINDRNTDAIMQEFDRMESLVNELNASYYDVSSDLEGKYSIHDKEISLLEGRLNAIEKEFRRHDENSEIERRSLVEEADRSTSKPDRSVAKPDLLTMGDKEKTLFRKRVIELRQKGMTLSQIARELGVGVGELQLFLNLNRNQ